MIENLTDIANLVVALAAAISALIGAWQVTRWGKAQAAAGHGKWLQNLDSAADTAVRAVEQAKKLGNELSRDGAAAMALLELKRLVPLVSEAEFAAARTAIEGAVNRFNQWHKQGG
jgi:ATP-dependent exoDNAse (exonuclease V) alpha subunit